MQLVEEHTPAGHASGEFMDRVSSSDEQIEGSLSTVFQNICGSKQCWFLHRSEVFCMVSEYGPPSLFLTLSCAEYDSEEIATYLKKVNNVSDNYPIGRLCTEDPLSENCYSYTLVKIKYMKQMFHLFNEV